MDPGILIPVTGYGGHERLVEMFALQYKKMGHDVDLLHTNGSLLPGISTYGIGAVGFPPSKKTARLAVLKAWKFLWLNRNKYDLIHNFGRLIYLLPVLNAPVKKIMTYGREISASNIKRIQQLPNRNLIFTGCSQSLINRAGVQGNWHAVYNAIEFDKYSLTENVAADAPLMFLGRIEKVKGCHTAIAVAKATGHKLIIAGNISPLQDEQAYFKEQIEPHIDGKQIVYVGALNDSQKNEWLGKCKALLMPIEWNEPFGIVMIEAMACGTPVIAFKRGSVPEVVVDGETGFIVNSAEQMIKSVDKLIQIKRDHCRMMARKKFDVEMIANRYLNLANAV